MIFDSRVFHAAKDFEYENEYEDAFHLDPHRGLAAVADGVSSGIFSQEWARLLVKAAAENPPEMYDPNAFPAWLVSLRQAWAADIGSRKLPFGQQQKLRQVGGGYSTLLWVEFYPEEPIAGQPQVYRTRCFAVGDSCIFHLRNGKLLRAFPMTTSAEFDADPVTICSVNRNHDHELEFQSFDDFCQEGDLLVLCTDAIAKWATGLLEAGETVDWARFWEVTDEAWREELNTHRVNRVMRRDDSTLVLLNMRGAGVVPAEPALVSVPAVAETVETVLSNETAPAEAVTLEPVTAETAGEQVLADVVVQTGGVPSSAAELESAVEVHETVSSETVSKSEVRTEPAAVPVEPAEAPVIETHGLRTPSEGTAPPS